MDDSRIIPAPLWQRELSQGFLWAPLLAGRAEGGKKSGLQPVNPQSAYQQAWLWSSLPNLQRNHHHLKPSWWTELPGTNKQSWLAVFAPQLQRLCQLKVQCITFLLLHSARSFFTGVDLLTPAQRGKSADHRTTGALKFPSNVILKRCWRTGRFTLVFLHMIRR